MATRLYTHPACLEHDMGAGHPRKDRLGSRAILTALQSPEFAALEWHEAPRASLDQIARAHPRGFVEALLEAVPRAGRVMLDGDTSLSPGSGEAALRAAGAVVAAVDAVMAGEVRNAFCAVRPPGHHAERGAGHGLLPVQQRRRRRRSRRATCMGWRASPSSISTSITATAPSTCSSATATCSTPRPTRWPFYPGTGAADETGRRQHRQRPAGADVGVARIPCRHDRRSCCPRWRRFRPDLLLISAGFDAHADDPLASLRLVEADFEWVTGDSHGRGRRVLSRPRGLDPRRRLRPARRWRPAPPPMCAADGRLRRTLIDARGSNGRKARTGNRSDELRGGPERAAGPGEGPGKGRGELDEAIRAYERGAALKQHCERKLREAQAKVDKIVVGADGSLSSEPMKFD